MCRLTQVDTQGAEHVALATPVSEASQEIEPQYQPWDSIGEPMQVPKAPHLTRVLFQNPDGLSLGHELEQVLEHIRDMECDHAVLPETKLDTHKGWVKAKVHHHCRRVFGTGEYRLTTAASPLEYHTPLKPGGLMSVTSGHLTGRVIETGADEFGRWLYTKFSCSGDKNITVIGIYQPCNQNIKTAGPTTSTIQQYSLLKQAQRHNPHKIREHYTTDLVTFVRRCQQNNELVCVGGDFNETLGDETDGLSKLMSQCGLRDVQTSLYGIDTHSFNTHKRGSKCIDYILMDPELMDSVEACGYEPFRVRILGDHRAVYMDVNTSLFFGSPTVPIPPAQLRLLNSRRINQIVPYFEALDKHLETHNWYDQIAQLETCMDNGTSNHALAERLDLRRIAGCQWAATQLKRYPAPPYSPELAELRNRDAILKTAISHRSV